MVILCLGPHQGKQTGTRIKKVDLILHVETNGAQWLQGPPKAQKPSSSSTSGKEKDKGNKDEDDDLPAALNVISKGKSAGAGKSRRSSNPPAF